MSASSWPRITLRRPTADLARQDGEGGQHQHQHQQLTGDEHGDLIAAPASPTATSSSPTQAHGSSNIAAISHAELTDLRAIQRTSDGAYARTALGQLSYSIVILRLFDPSFYYVGLAYTVLALLLVLISAYRYGLAVSNADRWTDVQLRTIRKPAVVVVDAQRRGGEEGAATEIGETTIQNNQGVASQDAAQGVGNPSTPSNPSLTIPGGSKGPNALERSMSTVSSQSRRSQIITTVVRPTFRTAGDVVALATLVLLGVQIALVFLVLRT